MPTLLPPINPHSTRPYLCPPPPQLHLIPPQPPQNHSPLVHGSLGLTDASYLSRPKSGSVAGCSVGLGDPPPYLLNPPPESHRQSWKDKQSPSRLSQSHPFYLTPPPVTHNAPLHAFCQRIPVVVASVAEAEYAAAFGGGQVLVELTLTLTNLGHPQQSPPLLFVDNECAIGLATSSVRPKKSKSIDMRLDWIRERAGQNFFRLVFLPGLINPADFFTKILPIYRHISALPFLHGTPHHPQPPHNFAPTIPPTTPHHHQRSSRRDAVRHRDPPTLASP